MIRSANMLCSLLHNTCIGPVKLPEIYKACACHLCPGCWAVTKPCRELYAPLISTRQQSTRSHYSGNCRRIQNLVVFRRLHFQLVAQSGRCKAHCRPNCKPTGWRRSRSRNCKRVWAPDFKQNVLHMMRDINGESRAQLEGRERDSGLYSELGVHDEENGKHMYRGWYISVLKHWWKTGYALVLRQYTWDDCLPEP